MKTFELNEQQIEYLKWLCEQELENPDQQSNTSRVILKGILTKLQDGN